MNSTDKENATKEVMDNKRKLIGVSKDSDHCNKCSKNTNTFVLLDDGKKVFKCVCCGSEKTEPEDVYDICHRHQK